MYYKFVVFEQRVAIVAHTLIPVGICYNVKKKTAS